MAPKSPAAVTARLERGDPDRIARHLMAHSGLPGPRGNLALAHAFADAAAACQGQALARAWNMSVEWTYLETRVAPENTPAAFLTFCGALALGAIAAAHPRRVRAALARLRACARDARWRTREGAATGLQRLLAGQRDAALTPLGRWIAGTDWLSMRAVAAAVAEPALLADPGIARAAVRWHAAIVRRALAARVRTDAAFRVLRQALGYSISVVTAARPGEGFVLLRQMAASGDRDAVWIVRENLKKHRIAARFPGETAAVAALLTGR